MNRGFQRMTMLIKVGLACGCLALIILWPEWRVELQGSTYYKARTDPWAQLTPAEKAEIEGDMARANSEPPGQVQDMRRTAAVMSMVAILMAYGEDFTSATPTYTPFVKDENGTPGEGVTGINSAGEITTFIGPPAFDEGSAAVLQSTIEHERVHAEQFQAGDPRSEVEAYTRELDNAQRTGLSQDEQNEVRRRLFEEMQAPPEEVQRADAHEHPPDCDTEESKDDHKRCVPLRLSIALSQSPIPFGTSVSRFVTLRNTSDEEPGSERSLRRGRPAKASFLSRANVNNPCPEWRAGRISLEREHRCGATK